MTIISLKEKIQVEINQGLKKNPLEINMIFNYQKYQTT